MYASVNAQPTSIEYSVNKWIYLYSTLIHQDKEDTDISTGSLQHQDWETTQQLG